MSDIKLITPKPGVKVKSAPGDADFLPATGRVMRMTPWLWRRHQEGVITLGNPPAVPPPAPPQPDDSPRPAPGARTPQPLPEQEAALADPPTSTLSLPPRSPTRGRRG